MDSLLINFITLGKSLSCSEPHLNSLYGIKAFIRVLSAALCSPLIQNYLLKLITEKANVFSLYIFLNLLHYIKVLMIHKGAL